MSPWQSGLRSFAACSDAALSSLHFLPLRDGLLAVRQPCWFKDEPSRDVYSYRPLQWCSSLRHFMQLQFYRDIYNILQSAKPALPQKTNRRVCNKRVEPLDLIHVLWLRLSSCSCGARYCGLCWPLRTLVSFLMKLPKRPAGRHRLGISSQAKLWIAQPAQKGSHSKRVMRSWGMVRVDGAGDLGTV